MYSLNTLESVTEANRGALSALSLQNDCGVNVGRNVITAAIKGNDVRFKNGAHKISEKARLYRRKQGLCQKESQSRQG